MTDLAQRMAQLRAHAPIDVAWDEPRARAALQQARQTRRRRGLLRSAALLLVLGALAPRPQPLPPPALALQATPAPQPQAAPAPAPPPRAPAPPEPPPRLAERAPPPAPHPRPPRSRVRVLSSTVVGAAGDEGTQTWKELALEGRFDQAYGQAYGQASGAPVADQPGDLLLLADVARLSRHPADAVAPLARLLEAHRGDPRAPLAAFTLGRVLLDDLGRPREAAASFQKALELDPEGQLAQDALAREVEAWSRAGDATQARQRALAYVLRYPEGRRLRSVRRYGALD